MLHDSCNRTLSSNRRASQFALYFMLYTLLLDTLYPTHALKCHVPKLTLKLLLPKDLRNHMLEEYVKDHLRQTGNTLVDELSFDHSQEGGLAEMHGGTVRGHLVVKVSDKSLDHEELEGLFESSNRNKVYETIVISPNKAEDRRTMPQFMDDNLSLTGWFRVRKIEDAMEYLAEKHKFGVLFERSDAYLVSTPRPAAKDGKVQESLRES
jgi:hypothetical protein